jgi:hypothetical protein
MARITRKRTSIWIKADDTHFDVHQEDGCMLCIEAGGDDLEDLEIFIDESLFPQIQAVLDEFARRKAAEESA